MPFGSGGWRRVLPGFYWLFAQSEYFWEQAKSLATGGAQPQFNASALKQLTVPLPPLNMQRAIVSSYKAEMALVAANRELIARMQARIDVTLARLLGEDTGPSA